jgi:hypothetical protein
MGFDVVGDATAPRPDLSETVEFVSRASRQ